MLGGAYFLSNIQLLANNSIEVPWHINKLMFLLFLGSYLCTNYKCKVDDAHRENIDWGHYKETDGSKRSCQVECFKDENCEAYEWSDTDEKEMCKWWNKGICQYGNGQKSDDPKFVSCKKIGNLNANQSIVSYNE